jgi:serine/threonine-protein kinase
MRVSFGPFAFDPESRLLWRDGTEIPLPPRVLGVLEALLARPGEVVPRQDLLDRVWKDAFVTDTSLGEAISFLRQALGDDPQSPRYIQTVHRRGYRFLVPPVPLPAPDAGSDRGQTGVRPGSDRGQTGVRPGSDHLRRTSAHGRPDWQLIPWSAAALCAGLALAAVWHTVATPAPDVPPVSRFEVHAAHGTAFSDEAQPIAVAPDGRSLAWSACEIASGRCAIYLRRVDRLEADRLAGTDDGHGPAFSPDGRWIAFFADGALKKTAVAGGAVTAVAPAPDPGGVTWTADGRLVFAGSAAGGLSTVDEESGAQPLTQPDGRHGELRHHSPAAFASGTARRSALAFTVSVDPDPATQGTLGFLGTDGREVRAARPIHRAVPAGGAYLLLATSSDLQAATFDERTLALTGAIDSVAAPGGDGTPRFAAGRDMLVLVRAAAPAQRTWTDGADATALARFTSIAVSPDSRRIAGVVADRGASDIWMADLASGTTTRLTFGGTNVSPAWSDDGARVIYATREGAGAYRVVSRPATEGVAPVNALPGVPPQTFPTSAAAGHVAFTRYADGRTSVLVTNGTAAPRVLTDGPYDEAAAALSPDGRWAALESSASGRTEIIVRATTDGRRVAVASVGGGRAPRWTADGSHIYFVSGRRLIRADFDASTASITARVTLLDRDGDRLVAVAPSGRALIDRQRAADTAVVVLHWLRELRERLPLPVNAPR